MSPLASSCFKTAIFISFLFSTLSSVFSQDKEWTWVSGDNLPGKPGIYGTKGISAPGNTPGGRYGAVQWKDASGNLWLMGGYGNASSGTGNLNDLWKYSPATNEWTWVSGDNTANQAGIYGTKGIPDAGNKPGARNAGTSFSDASGNLWLMGGYSAAGYLSDLWKFSPSTGEWTWVAGDNTANKRGIYGTKGTASAGNIPGARYNSNCFADANGDVWLFGGYGYGAAGADSYLNDLWKFTLSTGLWTWVSGDNTAGQVGVYGIKGEAATGNKPGARHLPAIWTDAGGNIWVFGGTGYALTTNFGALNDLWMFSLSAGTWTWVNGDNTKNAPGIYGTLGTAAVTNKPGARHGTIIWKDANDIIYLFGGIGYIANSNYGNLNDLWKLDPSSGQWTWIGGTTTINQKGTYGTKGTSAVANVPGARNSAVAWTDASGKLWIFGGSGYGSTVATGNLNDLWRYLMPSSILPVQFNYFTAHKTGDKVQLNWSTAREENSSYFIIERSSNGTAFQSIGKIAASDNSAAAVEYAFTDPAPLPGANFYRLKEADKDGSLLYSGVVKVTTEGNELYTLLQNPVQGNLQLKVDLTGTRKLKLAVKDGNGNLLMSQEKIFHKGSSLFSMSVDHLPQGVYYLIIAGEGVHNVKAFVKL